MYGSTTCTTLCPNGQYANSTSKQCLLCIQSCLTCTAQPSNCLTCGSSVGGQNLFLSSSKCVLICPNGQWGNTTDHKCYACSGGCASCTNFGLKYCSACNNVSSLIYYKTIGASICAQTCPDGSFIVASIPNFCQPCAKQCITCSIAADNCTNNNCSINFYYLNGSCLYQCPDNYFPDLSTRLCSQCTDGCQSCFASGLNSCIKCKALTNTTNYFLQTNGPTCGPNC